MKEQQVSTQRCSFCGRNQADVERMVAGPKDVAICNACVQQCAAIIQTYTQPPPPPPAAPHAPAA